jgi:hypothetical protein
MGASIAHMLDQSLGWPPLERGETAASWLFRLLNRQRLGQLATQLSRLWRDNEAGEVEIVDYH